MTGRSEGLLGLGVTTGISEGRSMLFLTQPLFMPHSLLPSQISIEQYSDSCTNRLSSTELDWLVVSYHPLAFPPLTNRIPLGEMRLLFFPLPQQSNQIIMEPQSAVFRSVGLK